MHACMLCCVLSLFLGFVVNTYLRERAEDLQILQIFFEFVIRVG
jgi:hypothetical protein